MFLNQAKCPVNCRHTIMPWVHKGLSTLLFTSSNLSSPYKALINPLSPCKYWHVSWLGDKSCLSRLHLWCHITKTSPRSCCKSCKYQQSIDIAAIMTRLIALKTKFIHHWCLWWNGRSHLWRACSPVYFKYLFATYSNDLEKHRKQRSYKSWVAKKEESLILNTNTLGGIKKKSHKMSTSISNV